MLLGECAGFNTWQLKELSGLNPNSAYRVIRRLEESGYIYSTLPASRCARPFYLTDQGMVVVASVNSMWDEVVRLGVKVVEAVPEILRIKRKYVKKVRQIEPFTIGSMD